ncbi:MAG: cation-translocating P-type ATPase [Planctomycetota bacterium]
MSAQSCCNHHSEKDNCSAPLKGGNAAQVTIPIGGMHCPACAINIEKSVCHLNGIIDANVNFIEERITVKYDPFRVDIEQIRKAITKPGYLIKETAFERARAFWNERIFFIQMVLCAALIISAWIIHFLKIAPHPIIWKLHLSDILSLSVIVIGGYTIFKGAIQALLVKDLTVFSLVSIASIAAVIVGAYKEAAMVIMIMIIGETLERASLRKSRKAISKLMNLTPISALVKRNNTELEIPVDEVNPDDMVIIKPGVRIPVDGVIIKGEGTVNESTLTGESLPVDKKEGDKVYSGTINEGAAFEMKATHTGDKTRFALIKRLILEAESQKAPIQRIADRYARYFVPFILLMSIVVYALTMNYFMAITILIVACPCALVLATPTAVIAGLTNGSHQGILIKGGQYLEALGELDALLIDKTGTLTSGKLSVTDVIPLGNTTGDELLNLAAIAEKRSEHPIARAIIRKTNELKISVPESEDFELFKGTGVKIRYKNDTVLVGNSRLLSTQGISIGQNVSEMVTKLESQGRTTLLIVRKNEVCGIIGLTDTAKANAFDTIKKLKQMGFKKIACITGDNQRVASAVSKEVGLEEYYAQMLPEDKVGKIKELKQQGFKVGMVGDGVNDAPALAAADVGLAMGAFGSDVAIEAANVSLMSDDLTKIPDAISLSRRVLTIIRQNFIFAIAYNVVMLVLVTQFVHEQHNMVFGAIAHQFSSLMVIFNSLRLLK